MLLDLNPLVQILPLKEFFIANFSSRTTVSICLGAVNDEDFSSFLITLEPERLPWLFIETGRTSISSSITTTEEIEVLSSTLFLLLRPGHVFLPHSVLTSF